LRQVEHDHPSVDSIRDDADVKHLNARYYRRDLALVHHLGFGFHADLVAPGILKLLEPIRARNGLVVELGCGSGLLTRHLVDAGHRVVATDASPAMLALARKTVPDADGLAQLVLPDDPIPGCDAIVSVGHPLSYLPDEQSIDRAFIAAADALAPGGVLAVDICDLEWGVSRRDAPSLGRVGKNWAIITEYSMPSPNHFVRQMAVFVRNDDGSWRRDDERHDNVLQRSHRQRPPASAARPASSRRDRCRLLRSRVIARRLTRRDRIPTRRRLLTGGAQSDVSCCAKTPVTGVLHNKVGDQCRPGVRRRSRKMASNPYWHRNTWSFRKFCRTPIRQPRTVYRRFRKRHPSTTRGCL
jgi:SAM-dependent methyltransferase